MFYLEFVCVVYGWFYVWIVRYKVEGNYDLESIFDFFGIFLEMILIKFLIFIVNGICFVIVCVYGLLYVYLVRI